MACVGVARDVSVRRFSQACQSLFWKGIPLQVRTALDNIDVYHSASYLTPLEARAEFELTAAPGRQLPTAEQQCPSERLLVTSLMSWSTITAEDVPQS